MGLAKMLPVRSPLGWLVTAGAVALAISPTARKKAREWTVRGMVSVLEWADELGNRNKATSPKMEMGEYHFDFSKDLMKSSDLKQKEKESNQSFASDLNVDLKSADQ